jgi:hypothetical protein
MFFQLIGRYLRLRQELLHVFASKPFQRDRAERLGGDLAAARAAVVRARNVDEQSGDSLTCAASAFLLPPSDFGEGTEWPGTI